MPHGESPNLDRLAILDDKGRRRKLHPLHVEGRFQRLKPWVRWGLIGLWAVTPWIDVGGHPAVLMDIPQRKLFLMGSVFGPSDMPFVFFLLTGIGFSLILISALWGRVWCGWACPQTVFLEGLYRRTEERIEGDGHKRMALDLGPWTLNKIARKTLKHALFVLFSFVIAHILLSYFVSLPRIVDMVLDSPSEHWTAFLWAAAITGVVHFNFMWFREQTCLIICPYGRLQSALQDRDTVVIGYDRGRGEPRGKKTAGANVGDCVDCKKCIAVCPTGIDIRNGLQMECIGCAACIDACDGIMLKLGRDKGLIRYDSERGLSGEKRRFFRPRLVGYLAAGLVGLSVLGAFAFSRTPLTVRVGRTAGLPYVVTTDATGKTTVQNQVMLHVENRSSLDRLLRLSPKEAAGVELIAPQTSVLLVPQQRHAFPLIVRFAPGVSAIDVELADDHGFATAVTVPLLAPASARSSP